MSWASKNKITCSWLVGRRADNILLTILFAAVIPTYISRCSNGRAMLWLMFMMTEDDTRWSVSAAATPKMVGPPWGCRLHSSRFVISFIGDQWATTGKTYRQNQNSLLSYWKINGTAEDFWAKMRKLIKCMKKILLFTPATAKSTKNATAFFIWTTVIYEGVTKGTEIHTKTFRKKYFTKLKKNFASGDGVKVINQPTTSWKTHLHLMQTLFPRAERGGERAVSAEMKACKQNAVMAHSHNI